MQELLAFRDDSLARFDMLYSNNPSEHTKDIFRKVFEDEHLSKRREKLFGEVFCMDLFDVGKNTALPQSLLNDLSWSPGEDAEFFAPGDFCGWPLRVWPNMKRPFIRLDSRVYCFDIFSLFDNIYRVLRRVIVQRDPAGPAASGCSQKSPWCCPSRTCRNCPWCRPSR